MSKKSVFILSLVSILSPALQIVLFLATTALEGISRTNVFYRGFAAVTIFWMFAGAATGLASGLTALIASIKLKNKSPVSLPQIITSSLGTALSLLWIAAIILKFPASTGI